MPNFDELIAEAMSASFCGWDFSWLGSRRTTTALPWDYGREVAERAAGARALLDLGTGGGEFLSGLPSRPRRTVATEGWPPNVGVAHRRLRPLGVRVVQVQGDRDNDAQDGTDPGRLPFLDGVFPLVINRHEAFLAAEVARVLEPGGVFVTQQVDSHHHDELWRLLGLDPPGQPESWLPLARRQVESAGLTVQAAVRGAATDWFHDAGAVLYYLRAIPWEVPGLSLDECAQRLRVADQAPGRWPVAVRQPRFLLIAGRAGPPGGPGR